MSSSESAGSLTYRFETKSWGQLHLTINENVTEAMDVESRICRIDPPPTGSKHGNLGRFRSKSNEKVTEAMDVELRICRVDSPLRVPNTQFGPVSFDKQ